MTEVGTSNNQLMVIYLVLLNNFMAIVYYVCDITISELLFLQWPRYSFNYEISEELER